MAVGAVNGDNKMAVSGDVKIAQDGGQSNVRLHPYLVALVRWCVSCIWSTATVLLHRIMTAPLQPIASSKSQKSRPVGTEHLHPEPLVECKVLHEPENPTVDVIFVHGLYGSLANTWRQGDWRSKYKKDPNKIPLRRSASIPTPCSSRCDSDQTDRPTDEQTNEENIYNCYEDKDELTFTNIDEKFYKNIKKMFPNDNDLITENFYNNTLLDQIEIVDNYESQEDFVRGLFNCDKNKGETETNKFQCDCQIEITEETCENCGKKLETNENFKINEVKIENNDKTKYNDANIERIENNNKNSEIDEVKIENNANIKGENCECDKNKNTKIDFKYKHYDKNEKNEVKCKCKLNGGSCEIGCGCACDSCYSPCWPRDWIKIDYPNARVLSINYTSDPHLWRPLWVKENKRLRLHERAEQMTKQLLELGVGRRPIVWVGHSKGGLFIKQIYCEAYEAYLKIQKTNPEYCKSIEMYINKRILDEQNNASCRKDNEINSLKDIDNIIEGYADIAAIVTKNIDTGGENINNNNSTKLKENNRVLANNDINLDKNIDNNYDNLIQNNEENEKSCAKIDMIASKTDNTNSYAKNEKMDGTAQKTNDTAKRIEVMSSESKEDLQELIRKADLWFKSAGFMFYSVPHRGSPLADIKTPITARSVELLEISKDCSLVLTLQERWLRAAERTRPHVRSLVETNRTLMSVLWLRIVSVDSADAGIGALCGVSVDHREICKPASRRCFLYTELTNLIHAAVAQCDKCDKL